MSALSKREMEVLIQIGHGFTVSDIATRLRLSVKTVSTYRARMLEKLIGVEIERKTTAALIRYAIEQGLVPMRNTA